ncbi:MAG: hypothetical protein KUL86_10830 [Castellaniella sp.]|nr:hypothetical protein [Castellaniella sp.]
MPEEIAEKFSLRSIRRGNPKDVSVSVSEFASWNDRRFKDASTLGALGWVNKDRMAERAIKSASPRKKERKSRAEILDKICSKVLSYAESATADDFAVINYLTSVADRSVVYPLAIICALHEYHHNNAAVISANNKERQINALKEKALAGLEAINEIQKLSAANLYSSSSLGKIDALHKRRLHELERHWSFAVRTLHPIRRNDATARERLFIYRIWQANMGIFRNSKTRAIQYFLLMEGIENQMDERNISKACAAFAEKYKDFSHSYHWRLFKHIRRNNCQGFDESYG